MLAGVELLRGIRKDRQNLVCLRQKRSYNIRLKKETVYVFRVYATYS